MNLRERRSTYLYLMLDSWYAPGHVVFQCRKYDHETHGAPVRMAIIVIIFVTRRKELQKSHPIPKRSLQNHCPSPNLLNHVRVELLKRFRGGNLIDSVRRRFRSMAHAASKIRKAYA
jgi:phosphoenolpyruvate carboxylase